jgi:hypothetical protein
MVRRTLRLLTVAAALLALGTCALFTDSLFPWYLSGVTDTLDLSPWIDDTLVPQDMSANDWWLEVSVLRDDSGTDRVFIAVQGYTTSRLIVLNSDLSLGAGANPIDGLGLGRRAMVDANDDFVIGNRVIDNPSLVPGATTPGWADDLGLSIGVGDNVLFAVDYGASPIRLLCNRYNSGWGATGNAGATISGSTEDHWELGAVAYDDQRAASQRVVLLLRKWTNDNDEGRVVYLPETDLLVGPLTEPLTSYPGFTVSPKDGVNRVSYTRKGVVVREHGGNATLFRFSESDSRPLQFSTRHDVLDAYDLDGEYFYVVDKDLRMLYKGRTGW